MKPKLLVVDDGDRHIELLHKLARHYRYATRCAEPGPCWTCPLRRGCTLTHAHDLSEAKAALAQHPDVDVLLLDVAFDLPKARLAPSRERDLERRQRLQGLDILAALRPDHPMLPVVLMTSHAELLDEASRQRLDHDEWATLAGDEGFDVRALSNTIGRVLEQRASDAGGTYLWGRTTAMARLRSAVMALARTSLPLLLGGETGTGKTALAERVIHAASGRRGQFVAVDLAALPSTLVAAELFGTARGAFSGAVERAGRLEAAHEGTLFLDEIGNLPGEVQRLLLRALEDGKVTRLGESKARPVDVRLVAATNADLEELVRRGSFRDDLLARLNPRARLVLPPLRERRADLEMLITGFVERTFERADERRLLAELGAAAGVPGRAPSVRFGAALPAAGEVQLVFARETLAALATYDWPGNLRELAQVVGGAVLLSVTDALAALRRNLVPADERSIVPIPPQRVRDLLRRRDAARAERGSRVRSLHDVARQLERAHYERLFIETNGDFAAMAERLVGSPASARQVRLRFNQLGLSARRLRKS